MKRNLPQTLDNQSPAKKQKLNNNTNVDVKNDDKSSIPSIPIDGKNLLKTILYPLDKDTFLNEYWTKKCYNVSMDNPDRVKDLLNGPFPFHLKTLLQETASPKIHVWMKENMQNNDDASKSNPKPHPKLLSFNVDDYDSALSCYNCGGNLYFRSSQELADIFISSIMSDLGIAIGSCYNDNNLRGEIEVFVSHQSHLTNWHFDFQHNFTIQLYGHKRWYLLPINSNNSSYFNVSRGNTPHYNNDAKSDFNAKETQFKLHRSESELFDFEEWKNFDIKPEYKDQIKIIDLKPGSILYFPSGQWHKVETMSNKSLSINLSLIPMNYSQLLSLSMNHFMNINKCFREPILFNNINKTHNKLNTLCNKLKTFISDINKYPSCFIPYSFSDQSLSIDNTVCIELVDFDDNADDIDVVKPVKPPQITAKSLFIINPLSVLLPFDDIFKQNDNNSLSDNQDLDKQFCSFEDLEEDEDVDIDDNNNNNNGQILKQYILHINFGDPDDFSSISRVVFQCKTQTTINVIQWIQDLRKSNATDVINFSCKEICDSVNKNSPNQIYHVLRVLTFFGWISVAK